MRILLLVPILSYDFIKTKNKLRYIFHKLVAKGTYHETLAPYILAALTPSHHDVVVKEARYEEIDFDEHFDLVGISCTTTDAPLVYKIVREFRKRGTKVILGGWHPSALPKEAKQHADSVVIGEAEEIWPTILRDAEMQRLKPFYRQRKPVDPEAIPVVTIHSRRFLPAVQATRGCPFQCNFCAETIMKYRSVFRKRPIENVIREISAIKKRFFIFHDASLTIDTSYTKKLFEALSDLNKKFFANGNVNVLSRDDRLLKLASDAGCVGWLVGFESISPKSLASAGKKSNMISDYVNAIKKVHDYGMMISGSFVFGFDGDTPDIFEKTFEFVRRSDIDLPDAMILTPFPGTPLFQKLSREKRILTKDWSKYDHRHVVFKPKHMSPEELYEKTISLFESFFSFSNIVRRYINSLPLGFYPSASTLLQNLTMATMNVRVAGV